MAYLQSRANIARAGVTYCGWVPANLRFTVGGTTRNPLFSNFTIEESLDSSPGRLVFYANPAVYEPAMYAPVTFAWSTPDFYWFSGTLLRRRFVLDKDLGRIWRCEAIDNTWLLDRYALVNAEYYGLGVNSIVARIVASFTNGFSVGYCPSSLGSIDSVFFSDSTVSAAFDQLAAACGAYWFIDPQRRIYFFETLPGGNDLTITNTSAIRVAEYDEDGTQTRNQTTVIGKGTQTTEAVPASATTIPVDDTTIFAAAGGQVRAGTNTVTYTGRSTPQGPGSLTGVTGISIPILQGESVEVLSTFADTGAQTTLASALGGGLSGVASYVIRNSSVTDPEARLLADEDVNSFKSVMKGFTFETTSRYTHERYVTIGKTIAVTLTSPITASGTLRVQTVSITPRGTLLGANPEFTRRVNARTLFRNVAALLARNV